MAWAILYARLLEVMFRCRFNAYRHDPDGEIEWLENMDAGNGWALLELETKRWAFIAPQA